MSDKLKTMVDLDEQLMITKDRLTDLLWNNEYPQDPDFIQSVKALEQEVSELEDAKSKGWLLWPMF